MNQQAELNQKESTTTIINTKLLMVVSAVFLGALGIVASFFPEEILGSYGASTNTISVLMVKIIGALYLGFGVLNWMAKGNIIGGIYSRPVALGNFFHFALIAITLLKLLVTNQATTSIITGAILYTVFAMCFGYILFAGGKSCG